MAKNIWNSWDLVNQMKSLQGSDLGPAMDYMTKNIEQAFKPRFNEAATNLYSRGFGKSGTTALNTYAPLYGALGSAISEGTQNLYFNKEANSRAWANYYLSRDLGLRQMEETETQGEWNRMPQFRKIFG